MKVTPLPHEKAAFIEASKRARQSLTQWAVQAMVDQAERQGVAVVPPKVKKGR